MADDIELNQKPLLRAGSLCTPEPHQQLLKAYEDRDFDNFQRILSSGIQQQYIDPNHVFDDPHYGTLLDIVLQEPSNYQYLKLLLGCGADPNKMNGRRKKAPLHWAVQNGDISYVNILVNDKRTNVNQLDNFGSTALHYAAKSQNVDCMISLLNHPKINVNVANRKGLTPIHIAAAEGSKESVLCLLQKEAIDIDNFKNAQNKSGRDAIVEQYPDLEEKLPSKSDVKDDNIQNRLFYLMHGHEIDNFIRSIQVNKDLVNSNDGHHTFLQYASQLGWLKVVTTLLRLGADPNVTHANNQQTPVMIASYKGYVDIVRSFINEKRTNFAPVNKETVLHCVIKGLSDTDVTLGADEQTERDHYACLNMLLQEAPRLMLNINAGDVKGNTALHYAAKTGDKKCILPLLQYGAYIGQRNRLNEPAMADVNPKILESYLDNYCVTTNDKLPREDNYEIIFRYNFLAPPVKAKQDSLTTSHTTLNVENNVTNYVINKEESSDIVSETDPLLYMSRSAELRPLLKHPVLTSFLHMKWHRIRCFFYFNLTFYILFWALLSSYILLAYLNFDKFTNNHDHSNTTNSKTLSLSNLDDTNEMISDNNRAVLLKVFVSVFLVLLVVRELFQLTISPLWYLTNPENWLEIGLIGITISILFCDSCISLRHQISSVAILLSWAELVLLIGRHPALSTNIEMFKTVSWNFLKFLAWYSILIIAFALSFYTLFCDSTTEEENYFVDPSMSVFKTIVMLTGEFDAGSIPFVAHPGTSHILFVLFVFLIAIVLFNLLNGLAVSDTQSIKADAELVGYVSRVKLISYVETMAMGNPVPYRGFLDKIRNVFCCIPNIHCCSINYTCLKIFSRKINLFPDLYPDCEIRILPNQDSRMYHASPKRKRQDVESDPETCFEVCYDKRMDPEIMKAAKQVLLKKNEEQTSKDMDSVFNMYKTQLESYKQTLDLIIKSSNKNKKEYISVEDYKDNDTTTEKTIADLSKRLDKYNDTLNILIRNSERTEEIMNRLLKCVEKRSPLLGSSSDEDNQ